MNTPITTNICQSICAFCQSFCNENHLINEHAEPITHDFVCTKCTSGLFPFSKITNNEFHFLIKDTFREVIKRFDDMNIGIDEGNDK